MEFLEIDTNNMLNVPISKFKVLNSPNLKRLYSPKYLNSQMHQFSDLHTGTCTDALKSSVQIPDPHMLYLSMFNLPQLQLQGSSSLFLIFQVPNIPKFEFAPTLPPYPFASIE